MTEEIIIDVSNCPHKRDDECMEVPICNEYGDLMGYQSCEAQTLCPYRSQKKIEHLEQLKNKYYQQTLGDEITISDLITKCNDLEQENRELKEIINKSAKSFCNDYLKTFEENKFLNKQIMEVEFNAQQEIEFLTEENNNYRSALEEIQQIAIDSYSTGTHTSCENGLKEIENKINEVLNDK